MNPQTELQDKERSYREDLANVQDVVMGHNDQEANHRGQRAQVEGLQKQAAMERQKVIVAIRERQQRLAGNYPAGKKDQTSTGCTNSSKPSTTPGRASKRPSGRSIGKSRT